MVGGIRDLESAQMAVQAALTGHLVLSTLHTNDAPSAVTRVLKLGIAPYLLNVTLNGIVAQRLVRTLCPQCKGKVALYRGEGESRSGPPSAVRRAVSASPRRPAAPTPPRARRPSPRAAERAIASQAGWLAPQRACAGS